MGDSGPHFDMHCHLGFAPNALEAASELDALGAGAFCATVTPEEYAAFAPRLSDYACVRVGIGLHPWWVQNADSQIEQAVSSVSETSFVGEIGLDCSPAHAATIERQRVVFDRMVAACAQAGGRLLTIHAVRSAEAVLDILEAHDVFDSCACILHWYSDSSQALHRALQAGCYISLGEKALATKRGREYAKAIPANRLLLETDWPREGCAYDVGAMQEQLAQALVHMAQLRNEDASELAATIVATSRNLLAC